MTTTSPEPTRAENFRRFLAHQLVERYGAEPESAPIVADILANATSFDEDGKVVVRDRFGMPTDAGIDDLVAEFRAAPGNGAFFKASTTKLDTKPATPRGPTSAPPQSMGPYGGRRLSDDEIASNRARIGTAGGNPWAEGSISLTRQVLVKAADPDLAARLKREAGR